MGQPLSNAATVSAQLAENPDCPHGTSATPVRAAMRQTSQVSSDCVSLSAVVDAPVLSSCCVRCCCCCCCCWSSSSASLASNTTSNPAVCVPRLWLMARRKCCVEYDPES